MSLSWGATCVKYLLFSFNLLLLIAGLTIFIVGVTVKAYYNHYDAFLKEEYYSASNLLIVIGMFIFAVSFFGCYGAITQNYCLTTTFCVCLVVIFILELTAGIMGYVLREQTSSYLEGKLNSTMHRYGNPHSTVTEAWDYIQRHLECCGVREASDWLSALKTKDNLPISCCDPQAGEIGSFNCTITSTYMYKSACEPKFAHYVKEHALVIGGVGIGFAVLQFLGVGFSCHLARHIKFYNAYEQF